MAEPSFTNKFINLLKKSVYMILASCRKQIFICSTPSIKDKISRESKTRILGFS
jgi:hypothetical protein